MKIYSCTQFFNELDLLEIRLETLAPYVDYFVISESTKTHSGLEKPLYYKENKDRYTKFRHKIIHQIIRDTPSTYKELLDIKPNNDLHQKAIKNVVDADWFDKNIESYLRDDYEKECLYLGLSGATNDDMVILGDLDEIPRPEKLERLIENFERDEIYHFQNGMYYYWFNNQKVSEQWFGSLALSFENLMNNSFCELRTHKKGNFIDDGGWHFTYMGGVDAVKKKVESWGEQSLNTVQVKNNLEDSINNCVKNNYDLFFRPSFFVVKDINDGTFPQYIVDNQDKFKLYIK